MYDNSIFFYGSEYRIQIFLKFELNKSEISQQIGIIDEKNFCCIWVSIAP